MLSRQEHGKILSAWNTWCIFVHSVNRYAAMNETEKVKEDQRVLILKKNTEMVLRTIQALISSSLSSGFLEWKRWIEQERTNGVIIMRYMKKLLMQTQTKCFLTWIDYVIERREMRTFVKRMLGGKRDQLVSRERSEQQAKRAAYIYNSKLTIHSAQLSAGFNSWKELTLYLREEEQQQLNEENAERIDDLSLNLSMKEKHLREQGEKQAIIM